MFGISMWEIVVIMVVGLLILGPRQLAEVARSAGKIYREIQKLTWDLKNTVDLDSITSPPKDTSLSSFPETKSETETTEASEKSSEASEAVENMEIEEPQDKSMSFMPGERSGPDFYADLIEKSREEAEAQAQAQDQPESVEPAKEERTSADNETDGGKTS